MDAEDFFDYPPDPTPPPLWAIILGASILALFIVQAYPA